MTLAHTNEVENVPDEVTEEQLKDPLQTCKLPSVRGHVGHFGR